MFLQGVDVFLFVAEADDFFDFAAVLQDDDGWDAGDVEFLRGCGVFVDVEFADKYFASVFFR